MFTFAVLAVLTTTAALPPGFVVEPYNGATHVPPGTAGYPFKVSMWVSAPNVPVELQVLREPKLDPTLDANWDILKIVYSSTTPFIWNANSPDPLYSISTTVTPVSDPSRQQGRWPVGKLVRLRASPCSPGSMSD